MRSSDADIISRMSIDSKDFSQGLDKALAGAESQLKASHTRLDQSLKAYSGVAANSAKQIVQAYGAEVPKLAKVSGALALASDGAAKAAGRQRMAYQQLGYQMSDVVAQASSGTNAFVIFAQQGGQVAMAMQNMGGKVGALAGFLAGPWGAAVMGAVTVLGLMASRAKEGTAALSAQESAADAHRQAVEALDAATGRLNKTQEDSIKIGVAAVRQDLERAIAARQLAQAELEKAQAFARSQEVLAAPAGGGDPGSRAGLAGGAAAGAFRIEQLQAEIAAQKAAETTARAQLAGAGFASTLARVKGELDPVVKATQAYEREQSRLRTAFEKGSISAERLSDELLKSEKRLEAARAVSRRSEKGAGSAQREAQKELRTAEKARETALEKENALLVQQGDRLRDIAAIYGRLEGGFGADFDRKLNGLGSRFPTGQSAFEGVGAGNLKDIAEREIEAAFGATTDRFQQEGIIAAQAIAQAFGGKVGGEVSKMAGLVRGLSSGDFTSVGGPVGGALTLLAKDPATRKALKDTFEPIADSLSGTFDEIGKSLGLANGASLAGSAISGFAMGNAIGGNVESGIGGAIGSTAGSAIGMAVGGPLGAAIGSALGSIVGAGIGGLFAGAKKGSVTLGSAGGLATAGAATGSSASRKQAAGQIGGSVVETLNSIAAALGADIGSYSVSVGQINDKFSVDTTGRGMVSKKYGATQFDSAEEAARFAIMDAINDGALTGVSQTVVNAIRSASSLEKGLDDAVALQSIGKRLREIEDPVNAAFDDVIDHFKELRETLIAAGGSAEELANLQKLQSLEVAEIAREQLSVLQSFKDSLLVGSASPLGLTEQRANAEAAFARFEADIRAGKQIDQGAFVSAGQNLLDVERQISGGTADYFAQFNRVRGLTDSAMAGVGNAVSIREAELAAAARSTANATAELVNGQNVAIAQNEQMIAQNAQIIAALARGGFVGGDAAMRGFARAS